MCSFKCSFLVEYSEVEDSFTDVELHDVKVENGVTDTTEDIIMVKDTEAQNKDKGQVKEKPTVSKTTNSKMAALKQTVRPCLRKANPLPENPTVCDKIKDMFLLPPHGIVGFILQITIICLQIWGILAAITGSEAMPGGNFFSLLVLFVLCVIGGRLISLANLPPLLGKHSARLYIFRYKHAFLLRSNKKKPTKYDSFSYSLLYYEELFTYFDITSGMLIVGVLLRNVPGIKIVGESIDPKWSGHLR